MATGGVPRTRTALRELLRARGLHPSRLRGQRFLVDPNLVEAVVRSAGVGPRDCVLEVGTGSGILTERLAERAGCVVTCEIDARLQELARGVREWPDRVVFLRADVLEAKHRLSPEVMERWTAEARRRGLELQVVSSLPYAVATPFLANLLWEGWPAREAVVLVQREAAERFCARPGGGDYGPMAVAVALLAEARILRRVPPQVFWPSPRVESALLRLRPKDVDAARRLRAEGLPELLRRGFGHRRKTLRKVFPEGRLRRAGLDPGDRPGTVPPEAWLRLLHEPP
ncbi:MAG: 16S rRNA (adenine(1518)-N(6)/adenine(1519)-N(6))-dimethyltransferase RsmA [Planctomycetota bacterium]